MKCLIDNILVILDNEFLKFFKTKTVKHKILFTGMQAKETPPICTLFFTSYSVHFHKQTLCTRFAKHVIEADKSFYEFGRKNTNADFLHPRLVTQQKTYDCLI